jgi:membrane protease YdiL (CAAX protease family)
MRERNGDSGSGRNRTEHLSRSECLSRRAMPLDRPSPAPAWLPDWTVRLNPGLQLVVLIGADYGFVQACRLNFGTQLLHSMPPCAQYALGLLFADESLGGYLLLSLLCVCVVNWLSDALAADQPPVWSVPPSDRTKIPLAACGLFFSFALSLVFYLVGDGLGELATSSGIPSSHGIEQALAPVVWFASSFDVLGSELFPFWQWDGGRWVFLRWRSLWLWWVLAGHVGSIPVYCAAKALSHTIFPILVDAGPTVSHQLAWLDTGDLLAIAIDALLTCVLTPISEEVRYRAFLVAALSYYMPVELAVPVQGVIFGAMHGSIQLLLPIAAVGSCFPFLYARSSNLLVPIIMHALWNLLAAIAH